MENTSASELTEYKAMLDQLCPETKVNVPKLALQIAIQGRLAGIKAYRVWGDMLRRIRAEDTILATGAIEAVYRLCKRGKPSKVHFTLRLLNEELRDRAAAQKMKDIFEIESKEKK